MSALAVEHQPHGERVKARACEDADVPQNRLFGERGCVILKGRRGYGQVKEREE